MKRISICLQCFSMLAVFCLVGYSQSSNIDNPTPITSDSISARISARDIGDPRATVHYYVFEGNQGDIFLNVESQNLNGDIDIFYADNLRPLTKISLFADSVPTRTGREIYLRKFERLILRVEGRTPTDEPATYSINFKGSFLAVKSKTPMEVPVTIGDKTDRDNGVRVNSVGTIIEKKPKATPERTEIEARNPRQTIKATTTPQPISTIKPKSKSVNKSRTTNDDNEKRSKKVEVIVTDNLRKTDNSEIDEKEKTSSPATRETKAKSVAANNNGRVPKQGNKTAKINPADDRRSDQARKLETALENVRLVVDFKDGAKIERPMNEVIRFGVDKGVLTIVNKNGSIGRYSILEISKITIE